jgi:Zn-dependent M16 (insulinase) family peptidase
MGGFALTGAGYFVSYRDPNLTETNKVYEKVVDYVRDFEADESEMTKYILGTFGDMDAPLNPAAKGKRSLEYYFMGVDEEYLLKNRTKMLSAQKEDIRALEPIIKAVVDSDYLCVIGNGDKITAEQDIFDKVTNLV